MSIRSSSTQVFVSPAREDDRFLPEGPRRIVLDGRGAIAWVNIQTSHDARSGSIHVRFDDGEQRCYPQPGRPGFFVPTTRANCLIVGMDKQVGLLDLSTNQFEPWATIPDDHPRTMINDGEPTPDGKAIVFGTKDFKFQESIAHLYLFTVDDRRITTLVDGHLCSNGKFFLSEGERLWLYDIDTPRRNVTRYRLDLARRSLSDAAVVIDTSSQPGFPDGMVATLNGSAIIAFYNPEAVPAGRAVRFDLSTGQPIEEWITPGSPRVTCPLLRAHGGVTELILTTATEGMPTEIRAACPNAGDLFIAKTTLSATPDVSINLGPNSPSTGPNHPLE